MFSYALQSLDKGESYHESCCPSVFDEKAGHVPISALKKRGRPKFRTFFKKKSLKKRDGPAKKCADGHPNHDTVRYLSAGAYPEIYRGRGFEIFLYGRENLVGFWYFFIL